jgi:hydroxymethylpyrimidine pyrophosphatase-like HAD family hydrolase
MTIQHIVSDVDGVLIEDDYTLHDDVKKLILTLQRSVPFSLATGRSLVSVQRTGLHLILTKGFLIVENGSEIIGPNGPLTAWNAQLLSQVESLHRLQQELTETYHIFEREKSFAIVGFKDFHLLDRFPDIKVVQNYEAFDFIPCLAGKENAIAYLLKKNLLPQEFACLGNGDNDLGMLKLAPHRFTVKDASDSVKTLLQSSGFIASRSGIDGGREILHHLINLLHQQKPF